MGGTPTSPLVRGAAVALLIFAATMGFDLPSPPVPAHAAWADVALLAAALLAAIALLRGRLHLPLVEIAPLAAYVAWIAVCACVADGSVVPRLAWALGAAALGALFVVTVLLIRADEQLAERLARAWIYGAVALGLVGLAVGVAAQLGVDVSPLHRGDGELGLRFRPAGLQRVGLVAELALVPLLLVAHDGARLLGRRTRTVALVTLTIVLVAGMTRTLLAAALGLVLLRVRRRWPRVLACMALVVLALLALRLDVQGGAGPGIRWRIAASALEHVRSHLLFGIGPTADVALVGWPTVDGPLRGWDAHDTLLDLAARAGVAGALLFVLVCARVERHARRARDDAFGAALCVGLWATAFDAFSVDVEHFRHVWLLLGLARAARRSPAQAMPGEHEDEQHDEDDAGRRPAGVAHARVPDAATDEREEKHDQQDGHQHGRSPA